MSMFDEILSRYGGLNDEWDEETKKNWEEKMSDPLKDHPMKQTDNDKTA